MLDLTLSIISGRNANCGFITRFKIKFLIPSPNGSQFSEANDNRGLKMMSEENLEVNI